MTIKEASILLGSKMAAPWWWSFTERDLLQLPEDEEGREWCLPFLSFHWIVVVNSGTVLWMKIKSPSAWHCAHHEGLALFRGSWVKMYIVTPGLVSPLIILLVRSPGLCLSSTLGSLVKGYWECWVKIISEVEYTAKDYKINKGKKGGFFFLNPYLSEESQARVGKINKRQMQEPGRLWEVESPKLVSNWKTHGGLVQREQKGPVVSVPFNIQ